MQIDISLKACYGVALYQWSKEYKAAKEAVLMVDDKYFFEKIQGFNGEEIEINNSPVFLKENAIVIYITDSLVEEDGGLSFLTLDLDEFDSDEEVVRHQVELKWDAMLKQHLIKVFGKRFTEEYFPCPLVPCWISWMEINY